jgi:hypothetical protein
LLFDATFKIQIQISCLSHLGIGLVQNLALALAISYWRVVGTVHSLVAAPKLKFYT